MVALLPPAFGYLVATLFGVIVGSFLNVVIHRVPLGESVVFPHSRCPTCGHVIAFYDNIPILSYIVLGGKCRGCRKHISARYPAVELLTGILFLLVAWRDGLIVQVPFDLIFVAALITLVFINADTLLLPNSITYSGLVFALAARAIIPFLGQTYNFDNLLPTLPPTIGLLAGGLVGAAASGGLIWVVAFLWEKLRGTEVVGYGNIKMQLMVGAYLGWKSALLSLAVGLLVGLISYPVFSRKSVLPSGVFLGLGAIVALLIGIQ